MNPVVVSIIVAVILIVAGLLMCGWREKAGPTLAPVVYWAGIIVLVLGLVLLLFPPLSWLYHQLTAMFGLG